MLLSLKWVLIAALALGALAAPVAVKAAEGSVPFSLKAVSISAGDSHVLALLSDGTVRAWGRNNIGQLGNGSIQPSNVAMPVYELYNGQHRMLTKIMAVSAGPQYSLALDENGVVYSWGFNASNELGRDPEYMVSYAAEPIAGLPKIVKISAGSTHAKALAEDGTVWAWGDNQAGQAGIGSMGSDNYIPAPVQVLASADVPLTDIRDIRSKGSQTYAIQGDEGKLLAWGYNGRGQLGDGTYTHRAYPVPVMKKDGTPLEQIRALGGGDEYGFAVGTDGALWAWGTNESGQHGMNDRTLRTRAEKLILPSGDPFQEVAMVDGGYSHALAVKEDGSLWAWGSNMNFLGDAYTGQLGLGDNINFTLTPQKVELAESGMAISDIQQVAVASLYSVVLRMDGTVWSTGRNNFGQLGGNRSETHLARFAQMTMTDPRQANWAISKTEVFLNEEATVSLQLADYWRRIAMFGTDTIEFQSSIGTIDGLVYEGNGKFSAKVASNAEGNAVISASINGIFIPAKQNVKFVSRETKFKEALDFVIADAEAELAATEEGVDPGQYPADARLAFTNAIAEAKAVSADPDAAYTLYDAARKALLNALLDYWDSEIIEVDKSALNAVISESEDELASTTEGTDPGQYPASARTALSQAIAAAKIVASHSQATTGEVEQARAALSAALMAYRAAEVPEPDAPAWTAGELEATDVTGTALKLVWPEAKADAGVTGYRIYVGNDPDPLAEIASGQENSYLVEGLHKGVRYSFTVKAYNDAGESAGLSIEAVTLADKTALLDQLQRAKERLDDTSEGTSPGTYPARARTALTAAIAAAEAEAGKADSLQTSIDAAATALLQAIAAYDSSVITPGPTNPGGPVIVPVLSSSNELKQLGIMAGGTRIELIPAFSPTVFDYKIVTDAEELEISFELAHQGAKATVRQDGKEISGNLWKLNTGDNTFTITIAAEDGTERVYRLSVTRLASEPKPPQKELTDIAGHWAENEIKQAAALGLADGYPDQTFRPDQSVTRAEFVVMLVKLLQPKQSGTAHSFADQASIGAWAEQAAAQALELGWVQGYEDGTFRPNQSISRAEAAVITARALGIGGNKDASTGFGDDDRIPSWAKASIEALRLKGIVGGRGANQYMPQAGITRAESITLLMRLYEGSETE